MVRLSHSDTSDGLKQLIEGRITALAKVYTLFVESRWAGAELHSLVAQELLAYIGEKEARVRIDGPAVMLEPSTAQTIGISLHELATNAAKYGSLSAAGGHAEIAWSISADGRLSLRWAGLERRTSRSGKDSIDHAPGGHDDLANAVAGVVHLALGKGAPLSILDNVMRWARLPRGMVGFARACAHSTASTPQQAMAMDSISASDRYDQSRGSSSRSYPTTPEHVGSMSWSDTRERLS
jgi:hypothetical protein